MSELRKDPVTGRWVIISTERGRRPSDFSIPKNPAKTGFCPFCPGNEDKTPPEIMAFRPQGTPANTSGWTLRVGWRGAGVGDQSRALSRIMT